MEQVPMFFEQIEDALGFIVSALGGAKRVGPELRGDIPAEAAGRWVLDCLNHDRPQFFHPGHVQKLLKMGRAAGVHVAMDWIAQDAGYTRPAPLEPQDEHAQLMRQFIQAAEIINKVMPRIGELQGQVDNPTMRVVK